MDMKAIDVHQYDVSFERQRRFLRSSTMREENKRLIEDFIRFCQECDRVGLARVTHYCFALRRIAELTDKNFRDLTESDIIDILSKLKEYTFKRGDGVYTYSENTMFGFKKTISKFWRWLFFDQYQGEAPPQIKRLKFKMKKGAEPVVYTREEIRKIIDGMPSLRDKAFFACLYDLQSREAELLSRQIKHVRYNEDGDIEILIEPTKTENTTPHWETLFESVSYFTTWMRLHPDPSNLDAPLWTARRYGSRNSTTTIPVSYALARKIFITTCKKQGITKPKRMHMFRKSKATHDMTDGVPIPYIESRGSWSKGSKALQECYLSISNQDKNKVYREKYNLAPNVKVEKTEMSRCHRCQFLIEAGAKFCARCGFPTDLKTAIEAKKIEKQATALIDEKMLSGLIKKYVIQELKGRDLQRDV